MLKVSSPIPLTLCHGDLMKEQRLEIRNWITPVVLMAVVAVTGQWALAAEGRITVPAVSGRAEVRIFSGHPGWVDAYRRGYGSGVSARIDAGGKFTLPPPDRPLYLLDDLQPH